MRRRSQPESIHVALHIVGVDAHGAHPLLQHGSIVQPLGTRENLLAAHEEVVRVGEQGVVGVGHGVEGSEGEGELVDDVVIGVVLLLDEDAERLLGRGAAQNGPDSARDSLR